MNPLFPALVLVVLLLAGCRPERPADPTAADKAMAEQVAALEEKVGRLQQLVLALDQRKPPVTTPRTVVVANTNDTQQARVEHRQYEQVMQSLAEAVEGLQQQEQGTTERLQSITEAIVSLEQAVLSLDAELRALRVQP